jgi:hypothetical protein
MATEKEEKFTQAGIFWNLPRLYTDLAVVKGEKLTPTERLHLRGLLSGHSPAKLAKLLYKDVRGTQANVCSTITQWVKVLLVEVKQVIEKAPRKMTTEDILELLEQAGYKKTSVNLNGVTLPVEALDGSVNINNIYQNRRDVRVEFNLRLMTSLPIEQLLKMFSQPEMMAKLQQQEIIDQESKA